MGQRLVVTVNFQGQDLAKIYYHWSAYTYSALHETKKILDCIYNHEDESEKELQLRLIRFCEENGGGIKGDDSEFEYIRNMYPGEEFKTENYSRSYGLIALSEKGMADLQMWSEGDVEIDLDEEMIHFGVYGWYEHLDYYNEERAEWDEDFEPLTLEEVPDIGYDLGEFSCADIEDIMTAIYNVDHVCRYGNEIYELDE